jgi:carboxylesterase
MSERTTSVAGASALPMTAVYQAKKLIRQVRHSIPDVTAPALVIHAAQDDVASVKSAEFVLAHIGSSDVEYVLLHDSYHMITLDNEKDLVADRSARFFLRRVARSATPLRSRGIPQDPSRAPSAIAA